jgi:hypothetical protein
VKYLTICLFLLLGCPVPDTCLPNTTRCTAVNTVELCDPDGLWREALDCTNLGTTGWTCCNSPEGHTCLPEGECSP